MSDRMTFALISSLRFACGVNNRAASIRAVRSIYPQYTPIAFRPIAFRPPPISPYCFAASGQRETWQTDFLFSRCGSTASPHACSNGSFGKREKGTKGKGDREKGGKGDGRIFLRDRLHVRNCAHMPDVHEPWIYPRDPFLFAPSRLLPHDPPRPPDRPAPTQACAVARFAPLSRG